jgi:hypothetical protein
MGEFFSLQWGIYDSNEVRVGCTNIAS